MIVIAVRSRAIRNTAVRAARRLEPNSPIFTPPDLPSLFSRTPAGRFLIIHDFAPDAKASTALLREERARGGAFGVLALLAPPVTPVLDLLVGYPGDLPLVAVVIAGEEGPERLAERVREAMVRGGRRELLELVCTGWRLDPVLARVAECELTGERSHTTLEGLLREAGVGRKRFVSAATDCGVSPPLRFLQGLRVMEAADLLQQGCSVHHTAERLGYGSLDTLRCHFRRLAGITPRAARARGLHEVVAAVGAGLKIENGELRTEN